MIALYVSLHAAGWPLELIILGLIVYLVPFLMLQVFAKPYTENMLNWLDLMGQGVIISYLLTELIEVIKANGDKD